MGSMFSKNENGSSQPPAAVKTAPANSDSPASKQEASVQEHNKDIEHLETATQQMKLDTPSSPENVAKDTAPGIGTEKKENEEIPKPAEDTTAVKENPTVDNLESTHPAAADQSVHDKEQHQEAKEECNQECKEEHKEECKEEHKEEHKEECKEQPSEPTSAVEPSHDTHEEKTSAEPAPETNTTEACSTGVEGHESCTATEQCTMEQCEQSQGEIVEQNMQ